MVSGVASAGRNGELLTTDGLVTTDVVCVLEADSSCSKHAGFVVSESMIGSNQPVGDLNIGRLNALLSDSSMKILGPDPKSDSMAHATTPNKQMEISEQSECAQTEIHWLYERPTRLSRVKHTGIVLIPIGRYLN
ncbi:hypothetical protein T265_05238 [Opisthorchis viverrini]|uniref:Uncharacterized protein n=1 Tax=Opisthorchis viverrini TaxID=6198 RepID=A0A074ZL21_OPIVI|nr:hypothetical protein T265_05238 [Opisthorchis viverrini]KER27746.1 hypothetical protein T265_05238 [Opisthorchis viverrini]